MFFSFENNQIHPQPNFSSYLQQEEYNRFTISTIQIKYIPKIHTQIRKTNNKTKIKHETILGNINIRSRSEYKNNQSFETKIKLILKSISYIYVSINIENMMITWWRQKRQVQGRSKKLPERKTRSDELDQEWTLFCHIEKER